MIALLAPGQGSQTPGMLVAVAGAARRRRTARRVVEPSAASTWSRLGTTATAEEITDTAVTQPLVVAATLLATGN